MKVGSSLSIEVLSKQVSDLIAAGEVVERPVSVVKELVENSLDAGADSIAVEIQRGGLASIRVTDNGCGIAKNEVKTAFLRHATSKIKEAKDLDSIATMGFRGEALSSIAAVSKVRLLTRTADTEEGVLLELEGGVVKNLQPVGCPCGTTMLISDLFYNTPARLKFIKKDATEAGHVSDLLDSLALAHPDVSFSLIQNGRETLKTAGNSDLPGTAYSVLGGEVARHLLAVDYKTESLRVTGLVGTGETARSNRKGQFFFVNRRLVKSKIFYAAMDEATGGVVVGKRHPVCILNIEIDPTQIDINVHPSKLEVKFSHESDVYRLLYWGIKNAFYQEPVIPEITLPPLNEEKPETVVSAGVSPKPVVPPIATETFYSQPTTVKVMPISEEQPAPAALVMKAEQISAVLHSDPLPRLERDWMPKESAPLPAESKWRIVGQVFSTYIIAEKDDDILIVDQHAAHERLKYEQLLKQGRTQASQELLQPVVLDFAKSEQVLLTENKETFAQLGFEFEEFGGNSVRFNRVPTSLVGADLAAVIRELLDQMDGQRNKVESDFESRALFTIACKAAIKANHRLSESEMEDLLSDIARLENINTCPHGRPITLKLTKHELEKHFKRIV